MPVKNLLLSGQVTLPLDQLRCFECKKYLSCSPIGVLPNGNFICGRCFLASSDTPTTRVVQLENILSKTSFPCQFKQYGCKTNVLFDQVSKHELDCHYQLLKCPSLSACRWTGCVPQMHDHFKEHHTSMIKTKPEFKIAIGQIITPEVSMVVLNELVYVVKFVCNEILKYDIRYLSNIVYDSSGMLQLRNSADPTCSINLKVLECGRFDNTFYEASKEQVINIYELIVFLKNPSHITVKLSLKAIDSANQKVKLDYKRLESVRCSRCQYYSVPPFFNNKVGGVICFSCSRKEKNLYYITPKTSEETEMIVSGLNYPCRWNGCNFVGNSDAIRAHEISCNFHIYKCFYPSCKIQFKTGEALAHLGTHAECVNAVNGICKRDIFNYLNIPTLDFSPYYQWIYAIVKGALVTIKYALHKRKYLAVTFLHPEVSTTSLQLEHDHCKHKSKAFRLVSSMVTYIRLAECPVCFSENDVFTVTLGECLPLSETV